MRIQPQFLSAPTADTPLLLINVPAGSWVPPVDSPLVAFEAAVSGVDEYVLNVWHSNAALGLGVGIPAGGYLTFDDAASGTRAQGDTYMRYDSGNSTLDCVVDTVEVWNASITKVETEVELVDRKRPVIRYALLGA